MFPITQGRMIAVLGLAGIAFLTQGYTLVEKPNYRQMQVVKPTTVTAVRFSDVTVADANARIKANTFNIRQKTEQVTETMAGYFFGLDQERFVQLFGIFGANEETSANTFSRLRSDVEKWSGNGSQRIVTAHTTIAAIPAFKGVPDDSVLKDLTDSNFGIFVSDNMDGIKRVAAVMGPVASNVFVPVDMLVDELKAFGADVSSDYAWDVAEKNGWVASNGNRKVIRGDYFFGVWMGALAFYTY